MNHQEVGKYWDNNAEAWTKLSRMGCDVYRDYVSGPAFFEMLPEVSGLRGIDIGCGEGHSTRLLAQRGAKMTGIDISTKFIEHAKQAEEQLDIEYQVASSEKLPFADESFDFAIAIMSLMDMPTPDSAIIEAYRVLKPGGFFQFSILHPCFHTLRWKWIYDDQGNKVALECGDYFHEGFGEIEEWIFSTTPDELKEQLPPFRIPRFFRTLGSWLNILLDTGFILERFEEPRATDEAVRKYPGLDDTQIIAWFLLVRCRKPAGK
ncbi:MAG: class I SAM-dependent methyltransferase [Planctomycetota bacterium]